MVCGVSHQTRASLRHFTTAQFTLYICGLSEASHLATHPTSRTLVSCELYTTMGKSNNNPRPHYEPNSLRRYESFSCCETTSTANASGRVKVWDCLLRDLILI